MLNPMEGTEYASHTLINTSNRLVDLLQLRTTCIFKQVGFFKNLLVFEVSYAYDLFTTVDCYSQVRGLLC